MGGDTPQVISLPLRGKKEMLLMKKCVRALRHAWTMHTLTLTLTLYGRFEERLLLGAAETRKQTASSLETQCRSRAERVGEGARLKEPG